MRMATPAPGRLHPAGCGTRHCMAIRGCREMGCSIARLAMASTRLTTCMVAALSMAVTAMVVMVIGVMKEGVMKEGATSTMAAGFELVTPAAAFTVARVAAVSMAV